MSLGFNGGGESAWKGSSDRPSLPEVHHSIAVPIGGPWLKRLFAFIGPGYLIAVGYMDPGNWATDISGGAMFNMTLLSVVLVSSLLAIFLQALSAKLGIVTGRDLAQACRDGYSCTTSILLWLSAEIAIIACDLAEVIGSAIALNLLFGIPLVLGVLVTAADVILVLALQHRGFRWVESLVIGLIAAMIVIFGVEVALSRPDWAAAVRGLVPSVQIVRNPAMLYVSLGILGATVMPHNLYLHSSIVQTRRVGRTEGELRNAVRMTQIDSAVALALAFFVNAAILLLSAAVFYRSGHREVAEIGDAYRLLTPLLGATLAAPLFAVALLASGQNSTLTGTLAGQVILEGFVNVKIAPAFRRLISRSIAVIPAVGVVWYYGSGGLNSLMILSQVILSIQLSFAVFPLIQFTSDRKKMGAFVNKLPTKLVGYVMAVSIAAMNGYLVYTELAKRI